MSFSGCSEFRQRFLQLAQFKIIAKVVEWGKKFFVRSDMTSMPLYE